MMHDFCNNVKEFDKPFVWKKVDRPIKLEQQVKTQNKSTAVVYGECGQGKSTTLNCIVDLVKEVYLGTNSYGAEFKSNK